MVIFCAKKNQKQTQNKQKASDKCGALLAAVEINNHTPLNISKDFHLLSLFFVVSLFLHPLLPHLIVYFKNSYWSLNKYD